MLIRRERPDDVDAVEHVHRSAFAGRPPGNAEPVEVALLRALRADAGWVAALSLVAEDGDGCVCGHVVATEGRVGDLRAVGVGPIGVVPARQGRGVGHALVHALLAAADALHYPLAALLGDPAFYRRFGFVAGDTLGITAPDPSWGVHFQVRPLAAYRPGTAGVFRYAAPFDDL